MLFRFRHLGNGASLGRVAYWAGCSKGTVINSTRRVLTALLHPLFVQEVLKAPTSEEKEETKKWVEKQLCTAWRDGWLMVDGTLVQLYKKAPLVRQKLLRPKERVLAERPGMFGLLSVL